MLQEFSNFSLRPLQLSDVPSYTRNMNNPKVIRNLRHPVYPFTEEDAAAFIQRQEPLRDAGRAAIVVDGEAVGCITYAIGEKIQARTATLGYFLGEPYWGRGIMTEAVAFYVQHLLENPDILRIDADVFAWNPASERVLEKAGLRFEARLKNAVWKFDEVTDLLVYALVK